MGYQPLRVRLTTLEGQEYSPGDDKAIECFRCGFCCIGYHPRLSVEEIKSMGENLRISPDEFISRYVQVTQIGYLLQQTEYGCVFLDWENNGTRARCAIHSFRPEACRNWTPSLLRSECRDGLMRLRKDEKLLPAGDLYESQEQLEKFYASLRVR